MFTSSLFDRLLLVKRLHWQKVLEHFPMIVSLYNKMILIIADRLTKELCVGAYLTARRIHQISKKSGLLFTALYLKQCSTCLQIAYGGERQQGSLPVSVSLTRAGYPRIIPSFHRLLILKKDDHADRLVKMYLSFFSLAKIIQLSKPISKKTFMSINSPAADPLRVETTLDQITLMMVDTFERYIPWILDIPLCQGISWTPSWKTSPTMSTTVGFMRKFGFELTSEITSLKSPFLSFIQEVLSFDANLYFWDKMEVAPSDYPTVGALWMDLVRYPGDLDNDLFTGVSQDWFNRCVKGQFINMFSHVPSSVLLTPKQGNLRFISAGRLGQVLEGGGKRRIFAIGNFVCQRLLKPVHDWLMTVLGRIPMDGTFNQTKPLNRILQHMSFFCFDLSSATDRFPSEFSSRMLRFLWGDSFSKSVMAGLGFSPFRVPFVKRTNSHVIFEVGQPLGYYSSWPLFALSHHVLVWIAAEFAHPGLLFKDYALLGDDIVIADKAVADHYIRLLSELDIAISWQKSLISHSGAVEFAKRFIRKGVDLSPISARALMNTYHPYGLMAVYSRYPCKRVSTLARIGGVGYRKLSSIDHRPTKSFKRVLVMINKSSSLGLSWFFGGGVPLNPYLHGFVWNRLLKRFSVRDIVVPPVITDLDGDFDILEWTSLRSWVKQWLHYLYQYSCIIIDQDPSLDRFFDLPVVNTSWKISTTDDTLVRFGLIWRIHDLIGLMGVGFVQNALPKPSPFSGWLIGGCTDNTFLIEALGTNQPRAHSGVVVPGVQLNSSRNDPRMTTIRYKTLGVVERQLVMDYTRK